MPLVSFIIPAYNEERLLGRTLDALHAAARANGLVYEVIVADDASTDRTAEIAASHDARVVTVDARQIAVARNAGARAASGEWLVFVDADTMVSAGVLRSAIDALRSGVSGGSAIVRIDGRIPGLFRPLAFALPWMLRAARVAAGCFLFCTRAAFDAVGGFDERFYVAEEIVMSFALKRHGRFVVLGDAVVTSGRKLRSHSAREILAPFGRTLCHGSAVLRTRRGLTLWYGTRREDPEPPTGL